MLGKLVLRNAKRQLGDYVLYFITISCAVACMYAYNALIFSEQVKRLPRLEILPLMVIATSLLIYDRLYAQEAQQGAEYIYGFRAV